MEQEVEEQGVSFGVHVASRRPIESGCGRRDGIRQLGVFGSLVAFFLTSRAALLVKFRAAR